MSKNQITRITALFLFFVFIYLIRSVLLPIVVSIILFYLLNPLVNWLSNKRWKGLGIRREISIIIAFLLTAFIIYVGTMFIFPPFVNEFNQLANNFPTFISEAQANLKNLENTYPMPDELNSYVITWVQNLFSYMSNFVEQAVFGTVYVLGQFLQFILIPIIAFYMLLDEKNLVYGIIKLIPKEHKAKTSSMLKQINVVIENYIQGVAMLCLLVGVLSGFGLYFLNVNFYLILGLIAAISQIIPMIGPLIGLVPAVIVAIFSSPALAIEVAFLYFLIQIIVNYILAPKILGDKLNIHPLTVLIAILVLGSLLGAWGLFFAAPIVAILKILYLELQSD